MSETNEVKTRSFTIRLTPEDQAALAEYARAARSDEGFAAWIAGEGREAAE